LLKLVILHDEYRQPHAGSDRAQSRGCMKLLLKRFLQSNVHSFSVWDANSLIIPCGARRMVETAAHLVDPVIPQVPGRQWVLPLPIPLRILFTAHSKLLTPLLRIVHCVITGILLSKRGT
jgi:hypothetical protein